MLYAPGAAPAVAQPTVDGDLSDAGYVTVGTRDNTNDGFSDRTEVREIVYFADDASNVLYVGVKGKLPTGNDNGIGLWLNFQAQSGFSAGTSLGVGSGADHYLDGQGGNNNDFRADFEVDYLFAMSSNGTSTSVEYDGFETTNGAISSFGSSDQSGGTRTAAFFGSGENATFAFDNGGGSNQGFEMEVPYSALGGGGVSEVGAMEAFAVVVDSDGSFSNETVPGNLTTGNPGVNANFDVLTGGPYHGSGLFTSGSAGNWTAPGTWSGGVVPFAGADVEIDSDVTLNTDATVHDLTVRSGNTFTASDGNGRTFTFKHGGTFARNGTFAASDGTVAVSGSGTVTAPNGLSLNIVTVNDGTFDIQDRASIDGTLTVSTGGTFQLSSSDFVNAFNDVTIDGTLTLSQTNSRLRIENGDLTVNGTLNADANGIVETTGSNPAAIGGSTDPISLRSVEFDKGGGDATLNTGVRVSERMTLTSGTVNANGNLTLTSTASQTAAIAPTGRGQVNGNVAFERLVSFGPNTSHFRFLSVPTATTLDDEGSGANFGNFLSNMWTQSESGTGADGQVSASNASVYVYNEGADLNDSSPNPVNGWEGIGQSSGNWGQLNDLTSLSGQTNVDPGRGLLTFLFADHDFDGTDEGFPLTLTARGPVQAEEISGSIAPPITFTGSDGNGTANNGWNLIANPFMAPIDWNDIENLGLKNVDATIYVWDADDGAYATYTAGGGGRGGTGDQGPIIAPFQAFFVKATGSNPDIGDFQPRNKDLSSSPDLKTEPPGSPSPQITLGLRAAGDSSGEMTAFRFTEGAGPGKDAHDAYQLTPLRASYALVASEMSGSEALFDHQNRPVPAAQDTIDLAFDITESGTYTLGAGETMTFEYTAPKSAGTDGSTAIERMLKQGAPTVTKAGADSTLPAFRLFVGPEASLPVELAGFDARAEGAEVTLTWRTASETNNAAFHVQRRAVEASRRDGSTGWTTIGRVEGAGTTDRPQTYHFTDDEVPFAAEQLTYRLRQEDLDGTTRPSDPITVQLGAPSEAQLHAPFPNPARQQITLRYEVPEPTDVQIALYDVLGRRVSTVASGRTEAGRHEEIVSTASLAPGTYFLRLRADGRVRTRRLTVVR